MLLFLFGLNRSFSINVPQIWNFLIFLLTPIAIVPLLHLYLWVFYRCQAGAVRGSTPHLLLLLLPTQHRLILPPLLFATVLLFDSPARLRPTSAPLCCLRPLLPLSPHLLTELRVHHIPSPLCRLMERYSLWRSSSLLGLAPKIHTVRSVWLLLKVREVQIAVSVVINYD